MENSSSLSTNLLLQTTPQEIEGWVSEGNLKSRVKREFQGFELIDALDGGMFPEREVALAKLKRPGEYPQHVHHHSDAVFHIISGTATFMSLNEKRLVKPGDRLEIPRGKPHGFEIEDGQQFSFLTIQSPPIRDRHTGEEDYHLIEVV